MEYSALIRELSSALGIDLQLSDKGTCGVFFDDDEVMFEINDGRLFIMADLGPSGGREDAAVRLLQAANLGLETGFSCIGIDAEREQFTLCRVLEGDLSYPDFERSLALFVTAMRFWKEWLALPPAGDSAGGEQPVQAFAIRA